MAESSNGNCLCGCAQAWRAVHPPVRGHWLGCRPKVHAGFLKSWTAGNLNHKVVSSVLKHLQGGKRPNGVKRILVTGVLLSRLLPELPVSCSCLEDHGGWLI